MKAPRALSRRAALSLGAACATASAAEAASGADPAMKLCAMIEVSPSSDMLVLDRFYITYHSREVFRALKAWQRNYVSFRSYLPPPEARDTYGVKYGRLTEIQYDNIGEYSEGRANNIYGGSLNSYTSPPGGWAGDQKIFQSWRLLTSVNPQDMFLSLDTPSKPTPYIRWLVYFRYPKGISLEAGDAWYRGVHAKELAKLPGLKRFGMYQALAVSEARDYPRAAELWFDDYAAWRRAFLPRPGLTPPPWGGSFPFVESISMFIGENPDIDFVRDRPSIP